MEYSIYQSIKDAYQKGNSEDIKVEIFLSVYRKNEISNNFCSTSKRIQKLMKKLKKLQEKNDNIPLQNEYEKEIEELIKDKDELVNEAKSELSNEIHNPELIAERLISRYGRGLRIIDAIKGLATKNASYGKFVRNLFKDLDKKKLTKIFSSEKTYFEKIIEMEPKLKDNDYILTKEAALKIESFFVIFLLEKSVKDFSEDQLREMLEEIAHEISKNDKDFAQKILDISKSGNISVNLSRTLLQILRLSVGKGVFMNSAVIITNIILRQVMGKGMSYAKNAVFRKYVARILTSGPWAIVINIILLIPDLAAIFNRRDYVAAVNSILLLYLLRTET